MKTTSDEPETEREEPSCVDDALAAKMALLPSINAAVVISEYLGDPRLFGKLDSDALVASLIEGSELVWTNDLRRPEAMLLSQAQALQAIFTGLAHKAIQRGEPIKCMETYLRLALRAQNQSRMTLETLATIKNPPVVIARQANVSNGPMQVNNTVVAAASGSSRAYACECGGAVSSNFQIEQTELLEVRDGKWMDSRAAGSAGRADPDVETVAAVDRSPHG